MARFEMARAAQLVREAREDAVLTQVELAHRVGIAQSNLAAIESGRRSVSAELLEHILEGADYRPTLALRHAREQIVCEASQYGVKGVSVFGSLVRGEDHFDSDIDMIFDVDEAHNTLEISAFANRIEELTGFPVEAYASYSVCHDEAGLHLMETAVAL